MVFFNCILLSGHFQSIYFLKLNSLEVLLNKLHVLDYAVNDGTI